jgi:hypothetical protein
MADDFAHIDDYEPKVFKRIYGVPCARELIEYLSSDNMVLIPTKFHAYHCLPNAAFETIDVPQAQIANPLQKRTQRRARALTAATRLARGEGPQGTRRESTFAERTDYNNTQPPANTQITTVDVKDVATEKRRNGRPTNPIAQ